jgi:urea transport system permease protein
MLSQLFTGIGIGSVLLLVALGLVLTFGQMNVINMAHGEFIMAGAYTAFVIQSIWDNPTVSLFVSLPVAFVVAGMMGVALEIVLIRRLYGRPLDTLLVTWGVALVLQQAARDLFGSQGKQVVAPGWLSGGIDFLGITVPASRVFIFFLALASVTALYAVLQFTSLGRRVRAVVQNRQLAETSGIPTGWIDRTTFFIGSGLAGIAGVAITLLGSINSVIGVNYIVGAFLVVVVGGIGQIKGAVIAAFALGILQSYFEYAPNIGSSLAQACVFVCIVIFLQFRPQGLFTVRTRSLA